MYALITGASSGLGKQLAVKFAEENYNLILVARREDLLRKTKLQLESYNIDVKVIALDLSKIDNCFILFEQVKNYNLNLFINNAGFGNLGYFFETDLKTELELIDLNIKALQILTKLYINNYDHGCVVNIGSLAGDLPTPIHATYSATKAYVNNFSRAINFELKRNHRNVRVLTVAPGPIRTDFNKIANAKVTRGMDVKKCANIIYRGIKKQKEFIIPGFIMKSIYFINRFIPTTILMRLSHYIQKRK